MVAQETSEPSKPSEPSESLDALETTGEEKRESVAEVEREETKVSILEQEDGADIETEIKAEEELSTESEVPPETSDTETTTPPEITTEVPASELSKDQELEVTGEDEVDVDILEAKKTDYDFIPTKDTLTIITHLDVDGLLCAATIQKLINDPQRTAKKSELEDLTKVRMFFTSPPKIFSTLSKSVPDLNKIEEGDFTIGQLYICDLSLHRDTLLGSSIYDKTKWFDHHEINPDEQYDSEIENIELIIDSTSNSTTSIICDYFKIDCDFGSIADEVDTNNTQSETATRLQNLLGAIKLNTSGSKLQKILNELVQRIAEDINVINGEEYNSMIEEYTKWVDGFNTILDSKLQSKEIIGHKVGILEVENAAPVYSIYNKLKTHPEGPFDVIAVMIHKYYRLGKDKNNKFKNKKYTKIEFRTHTGEEIIELAKQLGGGGHKFASGTTIHDGFDSDELIKSIESYFSIPLESPNSKK